MSPNVASAALVLELREKVTILQKAAGSAQVLLAGIANPAYGSTKTIDLARVLTALIAAEDAATDAIATIAAAAEAAGARETAARGGARA